MRMTESLFSRWAPRTLRRNAPRIHAAENERSGGDGMRLRIRARQRVRTAGSPQVALKGLQDAELARIVLERPRQSLGARGEAHAATSALTAAVAALAPESRLDCLATPADFLNLRVSGRFLSKASAARHPAEPFHEFAYETLERTLQPPLRAALKDHFRWLMVGISFNVRGATAALPLLYLVDLTPRLQLAIVGRALNGHTVRTNGRERTPPDALLDAVRRDLATEVSAVVHPMRGLVGRLAPDSDEAMLVVALGGHAQDATH